MQMCLRSAAEVLFVQDDTQERIVDVEPAVITQSPAKEQSITTPCICGISE